MEKKNQRMGRRQNQRQKLSRKAILIIVSTGLGCLSVALFIFLNTSKVDQSMAAVSTYMVTEDVPVTDMTLEAPLLKARPAIGPNTLMLKAVKYERNDGVHANQ